MCSIRNGDRSRFALARRLVMRTRSPIALAGGRRHAHHKLYLVTGVQQAQIINFPRILMRELLQLRSRSDIMPSL